MIEVERLTKRYGSHTAVSGLAFGVPRGQICGFLGPNGAGKSTTLRMLTGYLAPTEGAIRIGGVDALEDPIEARKKIGYMPEACPLYPEMRVDEYLRYRASLKGVARRQTKARVEEALEQAAVKDVATRIIGQLSKGYRQRVGLADALVSDPPLLVLDEPTAGLDPNQIRQVRELVGKLAKNKTVLLSTHILPEVEAVCDRVLIIHEGRLVSDGTPDEIRSRMGTEQQVVLEGRGTVAAFRECLARVPEVRVLDIAEVAARRGDGVVRARVETRHDDDAEAIFGAVAAAGMALRELRRVEASLEDVFTDLTTTDVATDPTKAETPRTEPAEGDSETGEEVG